MNEFMQGRKDGFEGATKRPAAHFSPDYAYGYHRGAADRYSLMMAKIACGIAMLTIAAVVTGLGTDLF